jgi:hypothetical protein
LIFRKEIAMRALMIAAVLAFTAAPLAHAQPPDRSTSDRTQTGNGECRGPDGKDATNPKCKGAGPAPAASSVYRKDAKGLCRDENGKRVKAANCKAPS